MTNNASASVDKVRFRARKKGEPIKVLVFGGTFDPPHNNHFGVAFEMLRMLKCDVLWFSVCGNPPPYKNHVPAPANDRLTMLRLGVEQYVEDLVSKGISPNHFPYFVDEWEVNQSLIYPDKPTYTVDLLEHVKDEVARTLSPNSELYLGIGSDQAIEFSTWHDHERVATLAKVVTYLRDGSFENEAQKAAFAKAWPYELLTIPTLRHSHLSSTVIRGAMQAAYSNRRRGKDIVTNGYLCNVMPKRALAYAVAKRLYDPAAIAKRQQAAKSEPRKPRPEHPIIST